MECVSSSGQMDIEDVIPTPRNFVEDPIVIGNVIRELLNTEINSDDDFTAFVKAMQKDVHITLSPSKLLYVYRMMVNGKKIARNEHYEQFMKSKKVRGMSGVMVVTVVTSPWPKTAEQEYGLEVQEDVHKSDPFDKSQLTIELSAKYKTFSCKYSCHFCPSEPGQAKSYIKKEPAVARANQHRFDAVGQFRDRGITYLINGHHFDKVELIVLGGTWSSYPKDYQDEFIRDLYYSANTFYDKDFETNPRPRLSVEEEVKLNEDAFCRIIGLTLETRPDQITPDELIRFRRFGVTRVQLGIQHTDNELLKYVNRGCTTEDAINAIKLLKNSCFKVDIHLMPDLPNSDPEKDKIMFEYILNSPDLQADQWKIYPCSVVPWTRIETWYNNYKRNYDTDANPEGLTKVDNRKYKPYAEETYDDIRIQIGKTKDIPSSPLMELLMGVKDRIHPWIRINRLVRDIPGLYISGGNDREDLRQVLQKEMHLRGQKCKCIRCREVKNKKTDIELAELVVREYNASDGKEYFISYESPDRNTIYGFLRLRISAESGCVFPELINTALMRELHVYGTVVPVNKKNDESKSAQHMGFGKKLIKKAEELTHHFGLKRIAVIAGVGVRNYYRKQGYLDHMGLGNFQIKTLNPEEITSIPCDYVPPPAPFTIQVRKPEVKKVPTIFDKYGPEIIIAGLFLLYCVVIALK
ncbi:putative elongator complex protein 3 [Fadolivirus algeromassiliense]|jgi:histone acetyltransferase (RNA polymerase elongator complex component)|uniref:tRNA carboxymethyluridine synthase n=1 Tax=Fadolivirus FV1/VV64 TaxID=3070911 RepID=A0A7D3V5U4_9VIRU|nr:putative elongator complex protein 3 [Fadolivirus algeromassiliense]QKF94312.1 putative elongator complex protein 3 [Fadolivirus FV1/VV64]